MEIHDLNTEERQLEAVKKNAFAIGEINNPSEKMQREAIKGDPRAIKDIYNQSEDIQLEAVEKDGSVLNLIKNPSEKVKYIAAMNFFRIIFYKDLIIAEPRNKPYNRCAKTRDEWIEMTDERRARFLPAYYPVQYFNEWLEKVLEEHKLSQEKNHER